MRHMRVDALELGLGLVAEEELVGAGASATGIPTASQKFSKEISLLEPPVRWLVRAW